MKNVSVKRSARSDPELTNLKAELLTAQGDLTQAYRQFDQEPDHQRHGREIAGNGKAGGGLKAGEPLEQPEDEGPGTARQGQQGKEHVFFHRSILLTTRDLAREYITESAVCPWRSHFPPAGRIQWRDRPGGGPAKEEEMP